MEDRTPLWHNNQMQAAVGRPLTRHRVVSGFGSRTIKMLLIWSEILEFWSRQIAKHPGLTAMILMPGPRFQWWVAYASVMLPLTTRSDLLYYRWD